MKTETKVKQRSASKGAQVVVKQPNEIVTYLDKVGLVDKPVGKNMVALLSEFYTAIDEWKDSVDKIIVTDVTHTAQMDLARAGRISLMKKRTAVEDLVKKQRKLVQEKKADIDLEDTTWLRVFQIMEANFKTLEGKLREKEEFTERLEAKRKLELKIKRIELMTEIGAPIDAYKFDEMEEETFKAVYESAIQAKKDREALALIELRVEEERKAEAEKLRKENEELKAQVKVMAPVVPTISIKTITQEDLTEKQKFLNLAEAIENLEYPIFKSKQANAVLEAIISILEEVVEDIRETAHNYQ